MRLKIRAVAPGCTLISMEYTSSKTVFHITVHFTDSGFTSALREFPPLSKHRLFCRNRLDVHLNRAGLLLFVWSRNLQKPAFCWHSGFWCFPANCLTPYSVLPATKLSRFIEKYHSLISVANLDNFVAFLLPPIYLRLAGTWVPANMLVADSGPPL